MMENARAKTLITLRPHEAPTLEHASARVLLREIRERVRGVASAAGVDVVAYCTCDGVRVQHEAFVGALCTIVENAIRASRRGQTVVISARDAGDGESLWHVEDEGRGCSRDSLVELGEVSQTPDLSRAREVIEKHDGLLRFESAPGAGMMVTIWLPH